MSARYLFRLMASRSCARSGKTAWARKSRTFLPVNRRQDLRLAGRLFSGRASPLQHQQAGRFPCGVEFDHQTGFVARGCFHRGQSRGFSGDAVNRPGVDAHLIIFQSQGFPGISRRVNHPLIDHPFIQPECQASAARTVSYWNDARMKQKRDGRETGMGWAKRQKLRRYEEFVLPWGSAALFFAPAWFS